MVDARGYPLIVVEEKEGGFSVVVDGMPGCVAQGETIERAFSNIRAAQLAWMRECAESGCPIPPPPKESIFQVRGKLEHVRAVLKRKGD